MEFVQVMWLCEDKLKGKTAYFPLPSTSQKRRVLKLPILAGIGAKKDEGAKKEV